MKPIMASLLAVALAMAGCGSSPGTSAGGQLGSDTIAPNQTALDPTDDDPTDTPAPAEDAAPANDATEDDVDDGSGDEQTDDSSTEPDSKGAQASPAEPTGPPLEAGADVATIQALMEEIHTPTNNVSGQMQRLGPFPDIPTPTGAEITSLRVNMRDGFDGSNYNFRSEVMFKADGGGEDLITFYETNLAPLGWTLSGQSTETSSFGQEIFQLEYEILESNYTLEDFKVTVVVDDNNTTVQLNYVEEIDIEDRTAPERLEGWFGDSPPVPKDGEFRERSLWTSSIVGSTLHLDAAWRYVDVQEGQTADAIEALLPIGGYSLGERQDKDSYWVFDLRNEEFEDPQILISESDLSTGITASVTLSAEKDFLPSS